MRQVPARRLRVAKWTVLSRIAGWRSNRVLVRLRILDRRLGRLGFVLHDGSSLREFDEFLVIDDYLQARRPGRYEIHLKFGDRNDEAIIRTLRGGGPDAVALFLQVSIDLHEFGGISAVNAWVKVALPALPETEQHALVGMLIDTLAEHFDVEFHNRTIQ